MAIDNPCNCSRMVDMLTAISSMGTWHLWVGWEGVTSNRCLPRGYIWTPLHFALALVGPWLLNNCCHLEIEMSWRPHIVDLCSRIVLYYTTTTYICHTYIHCPFHTWHHNPLRPLCLLKIWERVLKYYQILQNMNTYFGNVLHSRILSRQHKCRLYVK